MLKSLSIFIFLCVSACCSKTIESEDPHFKGSHECIYGENDRIGCQCKDGTFSKATGSGACSGHGGVEKWLCK